MFLQNYLKEIKHLKLHIVSVVAVICLSYSVYLFPIDLTLILVKEDGFFEESTAIFFVIAAVLFFLCFLRTKNLFLLGLCLVLLMGAGEEISWGQRIFDFKTPESLDAINVQHEFNIHNIEVFHDSTLKGVKKTGLQRLTEINILYRIFSMIFFVCIPLFFYHINPRLELNEKIRMPIAPVTVGIFFFISWVIFYTLKYYFLPRGNSSMYYLGAGEIFEFTASYVYLVVAYYFYSRKDDKFLGNDIKQLIEIRD